METTGTRSRRAPYGNQSHQIQVWSRCGHSHKVQVRCRWQQDSPSPGEAQLETRSRCGPAKDQIHQAQVKPKWCSLSPGKGEAQRGNQSNQFSLRPRMGPEVPGQSEAQVWNRVSRSDDAWVRTIVTRAMQAQMGNRITRSW